MPNPPLLPPPIATPPSQRLRAARADRIAHWREKTIEAQQRLMAFDADVFEGRTAANPAERFALDLLLRCARLRYEIAADPIENYVG